MLHRNSGGHNSPGSSSKLGASSTRGKYKNEVMVEEVHGEVAADVLQAFALRALFAWLDRRKSGTIARSSTSSVPRSACATTPSTRRSRLVHEVVRDACPDVASGAAARGAGARAWNPGRPRHQLSASSGPHKCFAEVPRLSGRRDHRGGGTTPWRASRRRSGSKVAPDAVYMANHWFLPCSQRPPGRFGSEHTYAGSLRSPSG